MALRSTLRFGLTVISFWPFVPIASRATSYGRLILELAVDGRVPWTRKVVLGLAAAYVASPVDLVPDWVPFVGRIDDVMVTVLALDLFLEGIPRELMLEKMYALGIDGRELERDLETVRRLLPRPIRSVGRRLPVLLEAGAELVLTELRERGIIDAMDNDTEASSA
jgi:uncharacterized membrane protein YkvA (DUF1232 family)